MASSPHQNEIEKLHINSENQEKDMVEILEGPHQRHRRQSHTIEKGQNDQSEYNAKELKDALMVVKKIMKMERLGREAFWLWCPRWLQVWLVRVLQEILL